jgi:hypothetical protein
MTSDEEFRAATRAEIDRLMREHASIQDRGYDTAAQRRRIRDLIDDHLDQYAGDAEPQPVSPADAHYMLSRPLPDPHVGTCGMCGAVKGGAVKAGMVAAAFVCLTCDHLPIPRLGFAQD